MAWLNPIRKFGEYNCLLFNSSYLQYINDVLYDYNAFDLSTGDLISVPSNSLLRIGDEHIVLQIDNTYNSGRISHLSVFVDDVEVQYLYSGSLMTDFKVVMAVNEDSAGSSYIGLYSTTYNSTQIKLFVTSITEYLQVYIAPTYTWSPVSSIYGKLGNIDLSKILTINDGEPKSGTSSDVKLTTISLVKTLINRIVVDEDEVAVEYQVVDDNFEYIKLVYKQDSEPISVDDGMAIDLDPDESIIGISGICDGNVYYFKIFTNINESEAYEFRTAVIKPRDTIIELLKNGTLLNSNSLVPDPYLSTSNLETATSTLTSSGYEIVADYTQTTYAPSFYTILTQNNTPTTTGRTYKPLPATNSQDARFKFYDYFKIKFDMQINIPATDSGFAIRPVIYSNDSYEYLAIYVNPGDTYIRSDPNSDISINLQNVETDWVSYFDYVAGNYNTQPNLEFQLSFLKKAPFYFKLTIKEIQVKLNELFLPQCIPDVYVKIKTSSSSQSWKIKEVYQNVVQLGYNTFLLQPTSGTGTTTVYYVIPFNLTARDDLYVARDYYVKNASGYAAFGIETSDNLSGLPIYDANGDTVNKALIKREGTTTSFSNTLNKEDHTYLYKQVTSSSSRQGFIFYTDACKKLHINNKVVL